MPRVRKKGPKSLEAAAEDYAKKLYDRLRVGRGWRKDTSILLQEEYSRFSWAAADGGTFGVLMLWEYHQLVFATHQYLRYIREPATTKAFFEIAARELVVFNGHAMSLRFDESEKASMRQAAEKSMLLMRKWSETAEEARD